VNTIATESGVFSIPCFYSKMRFSLFPVSLAQSIWTSLGCTSVSLGDSFSVISKSRDTTCATWRSFKEKCRSGLPFYRFPVASETPDRESACQLQCLSKGLDVAGLLSSECRCGASKDLKHVWGILGESDDVFEVVDYLLPPSTLQGQSADCGVHIWEYVGPRGSGGTPITGLDISPLDEQYIRGIITGSPSTSTAEGSSSRRTQSLAAVSRAKPAKRNGAVPQVSRSRLSHATGWLLSMRDLANAISQLVESQKAGARVSKYNNFQLLRIITAARSITSQCYILA
jgi:hypothetical protein